MQLERSCDGQTDERRNLPFLQNTLYRRMVKNVDLMESIVFVKNVLVFISIIEA